jgi:hypothetical protein
MALFVVLTFNRGLRDMDSWLHGCKSTRSFYSRENEIMGNGDEESVQKISILDDILGEYTVCFMLFILKQFKLIELDHLTSTCCHLCQPDAVNW